MECLLQYIGLVSDYINQKWKHPLTIFFKQIHVCVFIKELWRCLVQSLMYVIVPKRHYISNVVKALSVVTQLDKSQCTPKGRLGDHKGNDANECTTCIYKIVKENHTFPLEKFNLSARNLKLIMLSWQHWNGAVKWRLRFWEMFAHCTWDVNIICGSCYCSTSCQIYLQNTLRMTWSNGGSSHDCSVLLITSHL